MTAPADFRRAMPAMTLLSRTRPFTASELRTWHAALGCYQLSTIIRAVHFVAAGLRHCAELGELYRVCREIETGVDPDSPLSDPEIRAMAQRLGLEV